MKKLIIALVSAATAVLSSWATTTSTSFVRETETTMLPTGWVGKQYNGENPPYFKLGENGALVNNNGTSWKRDALQTSCDIVSSRPATIDVVTYASQVNCNVVLFLASANYSVAVGNSYDVDNNNGNRILIGDLEGDASTCFVSFQVKSGLTNPTVNGDPIATTSDITIGGPLTYHIELNGTELSGTVTDGSIASPIEFSFTLPATYAFTTFGLALDGAAGNCGLKSVTIDDGYQASREPTTVYTKTNTLEGGFTLDGEDTELVRGDVIAAKLGTMTGSQWQMHLNKHAGHNYVFEKNEGSDNRFSVVSDIPADTTVTINEGVTVYFYNAGVNPKDHAVGDGLVVMGDGTLAVERTVTVNGHATISVATLDVSNADGYFKLADGASITVPAKLADGKVVTEVANKRVDWNATTKTYSLVQQRTMTVRAYDNTVRYYLNAKDEAGTSDAKIALEGDSVAIDNGTGFTAYYVAAEGYEITGTANNVVVNPDKTMAWYYFTTVSSDQNFDPQLVITPKASASVVKIGETGYPTLAAAVEAAQTGDELVVQNAIALDAAFAITEKNLTLNLGGTTLTMGSNKFDIDNSTVTITNGTIATTPGVLTLKGGSVVTLASDATIASGASPYMFEVADATLNVYGTIKTEQQAAIHATVDGGVINVYEGAEVYSTAYDAIRVNGKSGTVRVNVYGGTLRSAGGYPAIYNYYDNANVITITGGTIIGGVCIKSNSERATVTPLTSANCTAKFSTNMSDTTDPHWGLSLVNYCAEGYAPVKGSDGYFTIGQPVAMVDNDHYATIEAAVAAVKAGSTLKLTGDLALTQAIGLALGNTATTAKGMTLDLGGKTLTMGDKAFDVDNTKLVITNGTIATTPGVLTLKGGSVVTLANGAKIAGSGTYKFEVDDATFNVYGTVETLGAAEAAAAAIHANKNGGVINVFEGAYIHSDHNDAIRLNGEDIEDSCVTLNVYGGTIASDGGYPTIYAYKAKNASVINIYGGTLIGADQGIFQIGYKNDGTKARITPMTDACTAKFNMAAAGSWAGCRAIADLCADGYGPVEGTDGYYTIQRVYDITIVGAVNGMVETSVTNKVDVGKSVTITATPAEGYELETLTVKQGEDAVTVADGAFTMPAGNVTITATFALSSPPVAKIGEKTYTTLAAAFAAAKDGDTITLLSNVGLTSELDIVDFNGTLDLGGFELTNDESWKASGFDWLIDAYVSDASKTSEIVIKNGTLTIKDGHMLYVCCGTTLTIAADAVVNEIGVTGCANNLRTYGKVGGHNGVANNDIPCTINVYGTMTRTKGTLSSDDENGVVDQCLGKSVVNVYDGAVLTHTNGRVFKMSGGAPTVNVYGGTITGGGQVFHAYAAGNRVNFKGGTITGSAIFSNGNDAFTIEKLTVTGLGDGCATKFSTTTCQSKIGSVAVLCDEGYAPVLGSDGYYTIQAALPTWPTAWPADADADVKAAFGDWVAGKTIDDFSAAAVKNAFLLNVDPAAVPELKIISIAVAGGKATIKVDAGSADLATVNGILYVESSDDLANWTAFQLPVAGEIVGGDWTVTVNSGKFMKAKVDFKTPTAD